MTSNRPPGTPEPATAPVASRLWSSVAVGLALLAMALTVTAIVIRARLGTDVLWVTLESGLAQPLFACVGALIVARRPRNTIGWLLMIAALGWSTQLMGTAVALHADVRGMAETPPYIWFAWVGAYGWVVSFATFILLLPLLFPDGRLPSRRWRPVLWSALCMYGFGALQALAPGELPVVRDEFVLPANPAGIDALAPVLPALEVAVLFVFVPAIIGAVASPIVRFRRSRGVERQQVKWLVPPILLIPVILPLTGFAATETLGLLLGTVMMVSVPVVIGVSVLRYRLYEIDRIISRTVSYGLVTLTLVGIYVLGVVGLGALVRGLAGGDGGDLVVAASTLAVAAAFGPVRRRVQSGVDRRFNRARYDAAREVERFGTRLRDEVDLDTLATDLRTVAKQTLSPAFADVWLPSRTR